MSDAQLGELIPAEAQAKLIEAAATQGCAGR